MLTLFVAICLAINAHAVEQENRKFEKQEVVGESRQLSSYRTKRCIVVQKQSHSPHRTNPYGDESPDYTDGDEDNDSSFALHGVHHTGNSIGIPCTFAHGNFCTGHALHRFEVLSFRIFTINENFFQYV
ncbi:hypothetical protein DMENIID0001_023830 [Sergentomyia squamirostris]